MLLKKTITANIDLPDSLGMTALHWSAYYNNPEACRLLIRSSSNPANVDNEGRTAIHLCAANDTISCIRMLVDLSGPTLFTLQDSQGCTLLHHVVAIQNVNLLNALTSLLNNPWLTYINLNAKVIMFTFIIFSIIIINYKNNNYMIFTLYVDNRYICSLLFCFGFVEMNVIQLCIPVIMKINLPLLDNMLMNL